MRINEIITVGTAATALILSAALPAFADAQTPGSTTVAASASAAPLAACKAQAKEQVLIRAKATTNAGINGKIPQGKTVKCGKTKKGGTYKACHKKDNHWLSVSYRGHKGWAPKACMAKK